jgi:iron complex transport system permease protein
MNDKERHGRPLRRLRQRGKSEEVIPDSEAPTSENIRFDADSDNIFAESVDEGHRVDPRAQKVFILAAVLLVIYVLALIVPKDMLFKTWYSFRSEGFTFSWFVSDLQANINGLVAMFTGQEAGPVSYLSNAIKYVVIALAGAGLALCGAVYQGAFRNALVAPSTLGVMSGAQFGLMIWVVLFVKDDQWSSAEPWGRALLTGATGAGAGGAGAGGSAEGALGYLLGSYGIAVFSFIGCFLVVGIVLLFMRLSKARRVSGIMLIITGQVIGGVLGAVYSTVRYHWVVVNPYGAVAQSLTELQIASFYRVFGWADILALGIPLLITFLVVMRLRQRMMMLAFEEGESRSMGIDARRMRFMVVGLCTLLTAIIVSFCGAVGFVGFLVPHLARRLVGPNFKYLLPATTVLGGVFVLGAYLLLMMTLGSDFETMVGMFISIGGAFVFLVTALRGGGRFGAFR